MRKFFNKKLFISQYMLKSACLQCSQKKLACKIMLHIGKFTAETMTVFFSPLYKKTATAFQLCAVFELQFLFMQPVYRFSLLSSKVSIIDGFGNNIALPVIQRADRNIMYTQLPQIVQRYAQKQAQLHTDNTAV